MRYNLDSLIQHKLIKILRTDSYTKEEFKKKLLPLTTEQTEQSRFVFVFQMSP